jgi:hypothetical protein
MDTFIAGAGSPTLLYGVIMPLFLVLLLSALFVPSLIAAPGKVRSVGEAIHCYFLQAFGVLLMTVGSLPTIYSVLVGISYSGGTYFGLLLVFAAGGGLFLREDIRATGLDAAARSVPAAVFLCAFRIIGQVTLIVAVLSFMLSMMIGSTDVTGWWVMPLLMGIYGGLVAWCTRRPVAAWGSAASVGSLLKAPVRPMKAQAPGKIAAKKKR